MCCSSVSPSRSGHFNRTPLVPPLPLTRGEFVITARDSPPLPPTTCSASYACHTIKSTFSSSSSLNSPSFSCTWAGHGHDNLVDDDESIAGAGEGSRKWKEKHLRAGGGRQTLYGPIICILMINIRSRAAVFFLLFYCSFSSSSGCWDNDEDDDDAQIPRSLVTLYG